MRASALSGKSCSWATSRCALSASLPHSRGGFGGRNNLNVYLPFTSVQARFVGSQSLRSITVRVADNAATDIAEAGVTQLLTDRHIKKDFFIVNTDDIRQTITQTTQTLTLLVAAIAVISLIVGGIGVMNIMLVSVSERIGEIGVRMAVGARRTDILQQFLIEAVLVCLIGGSLGVSLALGFGWAFNAANVGFSLVFSSGRSKSPSSAPSSSASSSASCRRAMPRGSTRWRRWQGDTMWKSPPSLDPRASR